MEDLNKQHDELMGEAMKQFQKAFNAGYQLNKHEPELLNSILKTPNESDYLQAMKAGKKQQEKDKFVDQIKQTKDRSKDIEKER